MRFLAKVTIPSEKGDPAFESGALARTMQSAIEELRPEAAYFFEEDGNRECVFVFTLDIPSLLMQLFPDLDASIYATSVMNSAEFEQGLGDAQDKQPLEQELGDVNGEQPLDEESGFLADVSPVVRRQFGRPT